jgi:type I restriction enzyme, S subunit
VTSKSWPRTRLKNLVESAQAGVWGSEPEGNENDILCVRVADFDRQRLGLKSVDTVRSIPEGDRATRLLRPGDILLEKSGGTDANPVGFTVIFDGRYPAVSSNFIGRIRMREGQYPRFWLYALAASYLTRRTQKCVRQTTGIQNLDQGAFFNEIFAVPSFDEQCAIADYLDRETARIEALIEEQQRLIDMLRERRAAAIAVRLESLGPTTRLKHVSTVQTGVTLSGEGDLDAPERPYLRVANVQVGYVDLREIKTVRVSTDRAAASMLQPGDVLMTEGGDIDKLGRGALWRDELPNMLHQNHIFAVRPSEALDSEFLVWWLDGPVARTYFRTTAKQTTNLAGTNKWTLGNMPVPVPPLDEQRLVVEALDEQCAKIDALIAETEGFIELSRERRGALITAAVTGQIDVREMA